MPLATDIRLAVIAALDDGTIVPSGSVYDSPTANWAPEELPCIGVSVRTDLSEPRSLTSTPVRVNHEVMIQYVCADKDDAALAATLDAAEIAIVRAVRLDSDLGALTEAIEWTGSAKGRDVEADERRGACVVTLRCQVTETFDPTGLELLHEAVVTVEPPDGTTTTVPVTYEADAT
ncbi:MAG: hypothetical protein FJ087_16865 [Deltaproteobacteria bacterium]|nr:hypothetical protein [Deltaproteobacteria bacterium]